MAYILRTLTALAWALWLGGLVALFLFVQTMFKQDRDTAVIAAPMLFNAFEKYQLILATLGVVGTLGLIIGPRLRVAVPILEIFLLCGAAGAFSTLFVTSKMNALREQGQASSPEFKSLHGRSMVIYVSEAGLLVIAGLLMPRLMRDDRPWGDRSAQKEPTV